jgi:hypothetical protein
MMSYFFMRVTLPGNGVCDFFNLTPPLYPLLVYSQDLGSELDFEHLYTKRIADRPATKGRSLGKIKTRPAERSSGGVGHQSWVEEQIKKQIRILISKAAAKALGITKKGRPNSMATCGIYLRSGIGFLSCVKGFAGFALPCAIGLLYPDDRYAFVKFVCKCSKSSSDPNQ